MERNLLEAYVNKRSCALLGLGVSNFPLAQSLCDMGAKITVYDKKELSELGAPAAELKRRGVRFICGGTAFDRIDGDLIFRSPGIRPDIAGIREAIERGAELTSEMELFLSLTSARTFAITGSDGKTTTTTLTGMFLEAEAKRLSRGKVFVGGNIGEPLLCKLEGIKNEDSAVTELSSFQLMTLKRAPSHVAITNVSPNHLDWHKGMEEYITAKRNIIGKDTRRLVTNADCAVTLRLARELAESEDRPDIYLFSSKKASFREIFCFESKAGDRALFVRDGKVIISDGKVESVLLHTEDIKLPGVHNVENYMCAMGLTHTYCDPRIYVDIAKEFGGVRHRLELVRTLRGVDYYNSSIDSSPSRTAAALSALADRDIVIICGGYDKNIPYAPLAKALCAHVRAVVLTGQTAQKIENALLCCEDYAEGRPEIRRAKDFDHAVSLASSLAQEGGCVLLSPASASFDAFKNFAERGDRFCALVKEL